MAKSLARCINVEDFRERARARLPRPVVDFFDGAAEDEQTLARNRSAFGEWALQPQTMHDVSTVEPRTTVMGVDVAWPFIVSPTGMPGMLHPDGEMGILRAAEKVGSLYTLSTMSTRSIEDVAAATTGPKAFQLYLFRDRGLTLELLQRAKAAKYDALILTVDVQVPANRERDRRNGMVIPPKFTPSTVFDFAMRPAWCLNVLLRRPMSLANFSGGRADPGKPLLAFIAEQFDPSITWDDLAWVANHWGGPIAIKGILSPEDAARAADNGAGTIILSNHGGRQLDGAISPMDILPATVDLLAGKAEVIIDGGVRRGTDILKALALGAKGCSAGRVGLYGLGAGGTAGAVAALAALRGEYDRDLALLGVSATSQIGRNHIRRIAGRSA